MRYYPFLKQGYVRVWDVNLFLKGSSENEQMRVCLTGKIGGLSLLINGKRDSGVEVV